MGTVVMQIHPKTGNLIKAAMVAATLALLPGAANAIVLDVFKTSGTGASFLTPVSSITTIDTASTAASHYNLFSATGHPSVVPLGQNAANIWVHQDTGNPGNFGFGFIFGEDAPAGTPNNTALLNFRIVNSSTDPVVVVSDDAGEAVESPAGSNAFVGTYNYGNNSDGIMIDGISGNFTIIIDSVDFGSITTWNAASGDSNHVGLILGEEYRITLQGELPSGAPVTVSEPGMLVIIGLGLVGLGLARRKRTA